MDPAQLHHRLDLLLKSSNGTSSSSNVLSNTSDDSSSSDVSDGRNTTTSNIKLSHTRKNSNNGTTTSTITTKVMKRRNRRRSLELVAAAPISFMQRRRSASAADTDKNTTVARRRSLSCSQSATSDHTTPATASSLSSSNNSSPSNEEWISCLPPPISSSVPCVPVGAAIAQYNNHHRQGRRQERGRQDHLQHQHEQLIKRLKTIKEREEEETTTTANETERTVERNTKQSWSLSIPLSQKQQKETMESSPSISSSSSSSSNKRIPTTTASIPETSSSSAATTATATAQVITPRVTTSTATATAAGAPRKLPKLSLSAFRRPEQTIRLTGDDPWKWKNKNNFLPSHNTTSSTTTTTRIRQLEDEYDIRGVGCKVIGHGAFSTVRSARCKINPDLLVAVKSISKFDALRARRLRRHRHRGGHGHHHHTHTHHMDEWEILHLLQNNPHVLTLYDVFETDEEIHLVTELCDGGELFDAIQQKNKQGLRQQSFHGRAHFSEGQAARITHQVLQALVELHRLGIVHADIKSENILLLHDDESDIQIKLCDFGMARLHHPTDHHQHHHHSPQQQHPSSTIPNKSCGRTISGSGSSDGESSPQTPSLLSTFPDPATTNVPPEGCHGNCGPAVDIYALGVMLYILLCGFPPVFCNSVVEFPDAYWHSISEDAKEFVRGMLHHDPCSRMTAADALTKAWVRQQTTRTRRGSISANLELVRSRLLGSTDNSSNSSSNMDTDTIGGTNNTSNSSHESNDGDNGKLLSSPKRRRRRSMSIGDDHKLLLTTTSCQTGGDVHHIDMDGSSSSCKNKKRIRRGSLMLSPKRSIKQRRSMELSSMTDIDIDVCAATRVSEKTKTTSGVTVTACPE